MEKVLNTIDSWILNITVFLVPLVVFTGFPNVFITPKIIVLTVGIGLTLVVKAVKIILLKQIDWQVGSFDLPVFLIILATVLSSLLATPNRMEAFFLPGSATIVIAAGLTYFVINQSKIEVKKSLVWALIASATIVSITTLIIVSNLLNNFTFIPQVIKNPSFAITESYLATLIFLATIIPILLIKTVVEEDVLYRISMYIGLFIITVGIAISIYQILPGRVASPTFPNLQTSWHILTGTLKESPIWGIGPGNYLTAFNQYRPVSYNQTSLWSTKFSTASNFWMTFLTETGFAGLLAVIFLTIYLGRSFRKRISINHPQLISLIILIVLSLIFGSNLVLIVLLFIFLALNTKSHSINLTFTKFAPAITTSLLVIILVSVYFTFLVKSAAAEITFKHGYEAITTGNGKTAYNLINLAIKQNPQVDRYHASFAQLNLALAESISKKPGSDQLTDAERQSVSTLIQQSIAEGKAAVSLNTPRSNNWALLANIYRSITNIAQGSDQFAISSYNQAIALDPIDPSLRLTLGGVYFSLKRYDEAIAAFKTAVAAKPDLANAHYNLAIAYRETNNIKAAMAEITNVLSLVPQNSQDYKIAKKELESLQARLPVRVTTGQGETIVTPTPTNTP